MHNCAILFRLLIFSYIRGICSKKSSQQNVLISRTSAGNKIRDAGATALAEALRLNRSLSYIRIHSTSRDGVRRELALG